MDAAATGMPPPGEGYGWWAPRPPCRLPPSAAAQPPVSWRDGPLEVTGDVMAEDRPIFVLGCPRSGTTLLQLMLHAHPRIAIPPETRFLLTCYAARNTFGDMRTEASRRALAGAIVGKRQTLFFDLGLDAEEITEEIVAG